MAESENCFSADFRLRILLWIFFNYSVWCIKGTDESTLGHGFSLRRKRRQWHNCKTLSLRSGIQTLMRWRKHIVTSIHVQIVAKISVTSPIVINMPTREPIGWWNKEFFSVTFWTFEWQKQCLETNIFPILSALETTALSSRESHVDFNGSRKAFDRKTFQLCPVHLWQRHTVKVEKFCQRLDFTPNITVLSALPKCPRSVEKLKNVKR